MENNIRGHLDFVINKSHILLEVLDARFPKYCRIYKIEKYIKDRKKYIILVLNKADLVPENIINKIYNEFSKEYPTVYVSSIYRKGSKKLRSIIKRIGRNIDEDKIYVGVFGYPNTGKSSIINLLVGRKRAGTSPIPGFTKGIQYIRLSRKYYLIDSPGIVEIKNKYLGVIFGSYPPEKLEKPVIALKLLYEKLDKKFFIETYKIRDFNDFKEFLLRLKERFNVKDSDWINKISFKILYDWQKGKLKGYII